jgi:hypothetical protein
MKSAIETVEAIAARANGRDPGGDLVFTFPEVIEVIELCAANQIAVLGVEVFLLKNSLFYASGCSTYDIELSKRWPNVRKSDWEKYVADNNRHAEEFVRLDPRGDDQVYVLTSASWEEHEEIRALRKRI